jgi:hypothetical protein
MHSAPASLGALPKFWVFTVSVLWGLMSCYNFTCITQFTDACVEPSRHYTLCCVTDTFMVEHLSPTAACMQMIHLLSSKPFVSFGSLLSSKTSQTTPYLEMDPYLVGSLKSQVFCPYHHEVT